MIGGKCTNLNRTAGASIGSKVTPTAMRKAMNSSKSIDRPAGRSTKAVINPGSRAGLKDAKTVHLNGNYSGYLNPANQRDRMKSRNKVLDISYRNQQHSFKQRNTTSDSRLTSSKNSSISLINQRLR